MSYCRIEIVIHRSFFCSEVKVLDGPGVVEAVKMMFLNAMKGFLIFVGIASVTEGFAPSCTKYSPPQSQSSSSIFAGSNLERIEFKIFPDGRIEETVIGVKGTDCQKVTEDLNASLGKVVSTQPTEEMFEQKITIDESVTVNDGDSSSGWEGASSW